jgi:hypothetical protein
MGLRELRSAADGSAGSRFGFGRWIKGPLKGSFGHVGKIEALKAMYTCQQRTVAAWCNCRLQLVLSLYPGKGRQESVNIGRYAVAGSDCPQQFRHRRALV